MVSCSDTPGVAESVAAALLDASVGAAVPRDHDIDRQSTRQRHFRGCIARAAVHCAREFGQGQHGSARVYFWLGRRHGACRLLVSVRRGRWQARGAGDRQRRLQKRARAAQSAQ